MAIGDIRRKTYKLTLTIYLCLRERRIQKLNINYIKIYIIFDLTILKFLSYFK